MRAVSRRTTNAYGGQNTIELSTIHFKFFVLFFPLICTYLRQSWKRVLLRQFHFENIYCCGSICFVLAVRCPMPSSRSRPHALRVFFLVRSFCCWFILNFCDLSFTAGDTNECKRNVLCVCVWLLAHIESKNISVCVRDAMMIIGGFVNWTFVKLSARFLPSVGSTRAQTRIACQLSIRPTCINVSKCGTLQFAPSQFVFCF